MKIKKYIEVEDAKTVFAVDNRVDDKTFDIVCDILDNRVFPAMVKEHTLASWIPESDKVFESYCSNCKCKPITFNECEVWTRYCPYCGAEMGLFDEIIGEYQMEVNEDE